MLSLRGNTGYKIEYNCRAKMYQILFYESIIYEENGLDHSPVRVKLKKKKHYSRARHHVTRISISFDNFFFLNLQHY